MTALYRALATTAAILLAAPVFACTADVPTRTRDPEGDVEAALRAQFNTRVEPILVTACGGCHDNSSNQDAPKFMTTDSAHPEMYDQVKAWVGVTGDLLIDLDTVGDSYLLRKGVHAGGGGRAFREDELEAILPWIQAESDHATTVEYYQTDGIDVQFNNNTIDLGDVGQEALAGTIISFDYNSGDTVLYINNLEITAGPTGVYLEDPLIVPLIDGVPVLEPFDRFEGVTIDLASGELAPIGGGSEAIAHLADVYTPSRRLQIAFYFRELRPR